jgi:serine protease inhibitor
MARKLSLAVAIALILAGCGGGHRFNLALRQQATQALTSNAGAAVVEANNDFGFRLFAALVPGPPDENVFISPASIATALAMTYNGAAGETKTAMAEALGVAGVDLDDLNRANESLKDLLENIDAKVQLDIANSLWAREGIEFRDDFLQRNKRYYGAEVRALDFNSPGAVKTINKWVSHHTNGRIKGIIERIPPTFVLYLINAIYFKGEWKDKFDKGDTRERDFHLADGSTARHPMMSRHGDYPYYRGEGFAGVALPYGDGRAAMYILLPDEGVTLTELLGRLDAQSWEEWVGGFHEREGLVSIPRFTSEYGVELCDALEQLGMGIALTEAADFTGMHSEGGLWIGEVMHKTYVDVNEEGTEAAAATSVGMERAASMDEPFTFIADRPFFYAIRDNETEAILFMGVLLSPS